MKPQNTSIRVGARRAALGVVLASGIVAAVPAQAGWFSNIGSPVHNAASHVAATPGNIEAKIKDISAKLNTMFQKFAEGNPLLQKLKQIHLKENLLDIVDYIRDSRSDYDQFASTDVEYFRDDALRISL